MRDRLIIFLTAVAVLMTPALAWPRGYTLDIGSTATSGNTTDAVNAGVSVFFVDAPGGVSNPCTDTIIYPDMGRAYVYGLQLTGLTVSQVQQQKGGDASGTTFCVLVKFRMSGGPPWSSIDPYYFFYNHALNSGDTPYVVWLRGPPAEEARVEFVSTGATPYDGATARLLLPEYPGEYVFQPGKFMTGVTSAFGTSGSTNFTDVYPWPDGAQRAYFSPNGDDCFVGPKTRAVTSDDKIIVNQTEYPMDRVEYEASAFATGGVGNGVASVYFYTAPVREY